MEAASDLISKLGNRNGFRRSATSERPGQLRPSRPATAGRDGRYRIKRNYSPVLRDAGANGAAFSVVAGAVFGTRQPAAVVMDFSGWATLARNGPVSFMRVRTPSMVAGMARGALPFST